MENVEIAAALEQMADLLEIQEANPFRVRAYRNAARTVETTTTPLSRMVEEEADLTQLPWVGKEMARHIRELVTTGVLTPLDELSTKIPPSLIQLMRLPGVGPKKARQLWEKLEIKTMDELELAAREGRITGVAGFGAKSQQKILEGIAAVRRLSGRVRLSEADRLVEPLLAYLREAPGVERLEVAGSYRRRRETVGDLDLLAIAPEGGPVMERFLRYPRVAKVERSGPTRGTIILRSGLQIDLRIVPAESYGAALVYFTGSKEHNVKLRRRGVERGFKISEYGVFSNIGEEGEVEGAGGPSAEADGGGEAASEASTSPSGERLAGEDEAGVYATVGLPWIPPELREDRGEIEAAAAGKLPELIELADLRGDLQMHSTWSDGRNTLEEMLVACAARGYEYMAITDHSKALAMVQGLDAARLREQWKEIEEVAGRHPEIRLLRAMEVDILADGTLDLEDELLERLDLVVVSIHSRFELPAAQQTARIVKALEHPAADLLGHPTGRIINRREPIAFDVDEVLRCARENGVAVELNAQPDRLDLKDTHLMLARQLGLKVAISTDAHRIRELDVMRYGVEQARRAWLTRHDVLNALPLPALLAALGKERGSEEIRR